MKNRIIGFFRKGQKSVKSSARRRFLRMERLEDRTLMARDLYVNTHALWGGDVQQGEQNVVLAQLQMIGRKSNPNSLTFASEIGSEIHNLVRNPELRADLYRVDTRGRRTLGSDGNFESAIAVGSMNADGDLMFRFGGIGTVLAQRGVPLQVQVDVSPIAEDGMPIEFGLPKVGFLNSRMSSNVYHVGYDSNPLYVVNGAQDVHVTFDLSSVTDSFSPGDNNVRMATMRIATDGPAYMNNVYVAIEGRHADGSLIPDVDRVVEDIELRDPLTGEVWYAIPVGEVNGLEIVKFQGIYVDGSISLDIQLDQEGGVAANDRFRVHWVTETFGSGRTVDIAGLTGATDAYLMNVQAGDWNDRVIVSPTGVLSGNFRSVEMPQLNVAVKSIGSVDTAVKNEENINLLRFETRASGGDLLVTGADFVAAAGSLQNVRNVSWWIDTDGNQVVDTIVQRGVSVTNGRLVFNALVGGGFVDHNEISVISEIHADVASGLMPDRTLQLALDGASVKGEVLSSGASLASSQIVVTTVPSKTWTFVNQGDLFVSLDSTPTRSRQLLEGTLEQPIFRLQLRAQNEDVDVYKIYVSLTGVVTSIDRLELYTDGATTPFAMATISGVGSDPVPAGYTTFAVNMQNAQLVIPEGSSLDVIVQPRMKSDEQGAISGEAVKANLVVSNGFQPVLARGRSSSSNLSPNDNNTVANGEVIVGVDTVGPNTIIVGNSNVVVGSKFTSIVNANSDADNTNVPTGVSPFAQFRITAAVNNNTLNGLNKAALDSFVIYVDATNVLMDAAGFKVYNKADASTKVSAQALSMAGAPITGQATGPMMVKITGLSASAVDSLFESGEMSTIVLEGNILNPKIRSALNSSLQGSLETDQFFSWFDSDASLRKQVMGSNLSDTRIRSTGYRS